MGEGGRGGAGCCCIACIDFSVGKQGSSLPAACLPALPIYIDKKGHLGVAQLCKLTDLFLKAPVMRRY